MEGIGVKIPQKIFFSNDTVNYTVKNDFYFTVFKTNPNTGEKLTKKPNAGKGEAYPTIYIKGFEQLFKNDGSLNDKLDLFFKMFNTGGNSDWDISYGKFRDTDEGCVKIITAADYLSPNFSAGFQLSDKIEFTNAPAAPGPVTLTVYIDDFDIFFDGIADRISYNITIERGFAVYIEAFGAYETGRAEGENTPVSSVHKGDFCDISWRIEKNEKASAFLYDENGSIVANLPPYTVKIDRDRRFTLTAYNDFCSVSKNLVIYKTLWKSRDSKEFKFPKTDNKGHFKFYRDFGRKYYLYVHPVLYISDDLKTWVSFSENSAAPSNFDFYSSAFSENTFSVCYLSKSTLTYCEANLSTKAWKKYEIKRAGLSYAFVLFSVSGVKIVLAAGDDAGVFSLVNGQLINGSYLERFENGDVRGIDTITNGESCYIAVLFENGRLYFYDLNDDFKTDIFECSGFQSGGGIHLIKTNALYIAANGYMVEASGREKFSDFHFFPDYKKGTKPVLGEADGETIVGAFQTDAGIKIWEYKF
ncbi:MAG: hypothetical protein LBS21_15500 [Clostridiales bacterium]|nr:hypothetical protein [Clostridiales bacterium]